MLLFSVIKQIKNKPPQILSLDSLIPQLLLHFLLHPHNKTPPKTYLYSRSLIHLFPFPLKCILLRLSPPSLHQNFPAHRHQWSKIFHHLSFLSLLGLLAVLDRVDRSSPWLGSSEWRIWLWECCQILSWVLQRKKKIVGC